VNGYAKALSDLFRQAEWQLDRQHHSSHAIWKSPDGRKTVPIPQRIADRNLAKRIAKQAGLNPGLIR
jgi:predicted RNA binding protein YcfA (HicA-like mRNA interferase family)